MNKHNIKVRVEGMAVIKQEFKCKVFSVSLSLLRHVKYNSAFQLCEVKLNFDASSKSTTPAKHKWATLDWLSVQFLHLAGFFRYLVTELKEETAKMDWVCTKCQKSQTPATPDFLVYRFRKKEMAAKVPEAAV